MARKQAVQAQEEAAPAPVDEGFLDGFDQPDRLPLVPWIQFGHKIVTIAKGKQQLGAFELPLKNVPPQAAEALPTEIRIGDTVYPTEVREVDHGETPENALLMRGFHFVFVGQRETEWTDKGTGQRVAAYAPGAQSKQRFIGVWLDAWPHMRWCTLTVSSTAAQAVNAALKSLRQFLAGIEGRFGRVLPDYAVAVPLYCGKVRQIENADGSKGSLVEIEHGLPATVGTDVASIRPFIVPAEVRDWIQAPAQKDFVTQWTSYQAQESRGEQVATGHLAPEADLDDAGAAASARAFPAERPPRRPPAERSTRSPRPITANLRVRVSIKPERLPEEYQPFANQNFGDILAQEGGRGFVEWLAMNHEPANAGEAAVVAQAKSILDSLAPSA